MNEVDLEKISEGEKVVIHGEIYDLFWNDEDILTQITIEFSDSQGYKTMCIIGSEDLDITEEEILQADYIQVEGTKKVGLDVIGKNIKILK